MLKIVLLFSIVCTIWAVPLSSNIICPSGQHAVLCKRNPCEGAPCPLVPKASCVPSYCDGCYDTWYLDGKRVYCWGP